MFPVRTFLVLATAAVLGAGCAGTLQQSAAGDVYTKEDAAKTVVLHVDNLNMSPMELRTIANGRSLFVGSVAAQDSTDILLDRTLFPTGSLYLAAIGGDGRATRVGPIAAGKGDIIKLTVQPALELSRAIVVR